LRPTPIPFFNNKVIKEISAGKRHVLACDMNGFVYSWGCGDDGRLGLGDFEDRFEPCKLESLAHGVVTSFCAGDAHSIVNITELRIDPLLTSSSSSSSSSHHRNHKVNNNDNEHNDGGKRANQHSEQQQRRGSVPLGYRSIHDLACLAFPAGVYAFGRGAHGRLGLGRNSNKKTPTLISDWPDSFKVCQVLVVAKTYIPMLFYSLGYTHINVIIVKKKKSSQHELCMCVYIIKGYKVIKVSCGGAHSLLLSEKTTQPSIANKWGSHRQVFAFGSVQNPFKFQSSSIYLFCLDECACFVCVHVCVFIFIFIFLFGANNSQHINICNYISQPFRCGHSGQLGCEDLCDQYTPIRVKVSVHCSNTQTHWQFIYMYM
jgi:alpha-tubulin suppressor-like RCC1 family protein